jgi:tRNA (adenine57-N1/adenine58-N1)-methyltransferase catalytic subunit
VKRVLIKKERIMEVDGKKRVISDFEKHYVDPSKDFHTKYGIIRREDLSKESGSVLKCGNEEYHILDADFIDNYKQMARHAQIIGLKDIGTIITSTGINRDSKVLEAGSGSGALGCYLAAIAKKVVSYDIDQKNLAVAKANAESLGLKNITYDAGDIYDPAGITEHGFDVFVLDVPEPEKAIGTARKVLKIGGFLAVYLPNIMQVQDFLKDLPGSFLLEGVVEVIEREWVVDERRTRPTTKDHAHTAFLTFTRKLF